jgi:hypothetical protein
MTAIKCIHLRCDGGCGEFFDSSTIPSAGTVVEARRQAHRAGWVHDKTGRDVCGDCRTFKPPLQPRKG